MLYPKRVPEDLREIVLLKPRGWQAIIAESKRQGKNASGRQGTKSPLSLAVERLNAPDFDSLLNYAGRCGPHR